MDLHKIMYASALFLASSIAMAGPVTSTVDFSNGAQGWDGLKNVPGDTWVDASMGRDAPALRSSLDFFGVSFLNSTNQHYLGDYRKLGSVSIGLDVVANSITTGGGQLPRNFVVELRDYDNTPAGKAYTSVWYDLGVIDAANGWQHLSVTIADTTASALPAGWGGYGASDDSGLPPGRTFADVLSSIDEVAFTTIVPGMGFLYGLYDISVDNISFVAAAEVPEPSSYALMAGGLGLLGCMARRRPRRTPGT